MGVTVAVSGTANSTTCEKEVPSDPEIPAHAKNCGAQPKAGVQNVPRFDGGPVACGGREERAAGDVCSAERTVQIQAYPPWILTLKLAG